MSKAKDNGGPVFPEVRIRSGDNYNPPTKLYYGGMTLRQYAAIKLRVPDSGTDWLDEMIRTSQRNEVAAKAMQGFMSKASFTHYDYSPEAAAAYRAADAMLEASEK